MPLLPPSRAGPVLNKVFMTGLCYRPLPKNNWITDRLWLDKFIAAYTYIHLCTRSTMAQSRLWLCNLALLTIESEILDSILNDKSIDQFASARPYRILLIFKHNHEVKQLM